MQLNTKGRPVSAGPSLSRRRLLAFIAGLAAAPLLFSKNVAAAAAQLIGKWPTGNRTLAPFSCEDGILYIAGDKSVEARRPGAEKPIWRQPLEQPSVFRPRLDANIVLTAGRTHMAAWDRASGKHLWSLNCEKGEEFGVPLIHDGRIHFGQGPRLSQQGYRTTGQGPRLRAMEAATGQPLWSLPITPAAGIAYAPAAYKNMILFGPGNGILYAVSASDGSVLWKVDRGKKWQYLRQLHLHDDILVAGGYKEHAWGLSTKDGRKLWRFYAGNFINSHLVSGGIVYFWSPTGWIYGLNAKTGKRIWRHRTTSYNKKSRKKNWAPVMAELVADDKHLYVLAMDRILHVLNRKTGSRIGDYRLPVAVRPFVCLTGEPGKVVLGSSAGEIVYMDLS